MAALIQLLWAAALVTTTSRVVADISPGAFLLATGYAFDYTGAMFQVNASTGAYTEVLSSLPYSTYSVDLDPVRQTAYWSDWQSGTIQSYSLSGGVLTSVYQLQGCAGGFVGCGTPDGLAVDYLEQLVFYADDVRNHIAVVSTNGSNHRVLLNTEGGPYGLALDLLREVVYYTVYVGPAMIGRVCYNGSAHAVVVNSLPAQPSGITLDRREGRLYWCSYNAKRIDSARTDGTDRRTVLPGASNIFGLAFLTLLGDTLYFSDYESAGLRSVKTDGTGDSLLVSFVIENLRGVAAFDPDDVVTLTQKRDANITVCSVPVISSTSTTTPTSTITTVSTVSTTASSTRSGTTQSVPTSSEVQVTSDITHGPDVNPGSSDVTTVTPRMTTVAADTRTTQSVPTSSEVQVTPRMTTVAADTPDSPLVIVALSVGLLVLVLLVVVAVVVVCKRRKSSQRPRTGIVEDLIYFPRNGDAPTYDELGSVSSQLQPPLLPDRPTPFPHSLVPRDSSGSSSAYASVSELRLHSTSSGSQPAEVRNGDSSGGLSSESEAYNHVALVPWSDRSLANGGFGRGGENDGSGGNFSAESVPYATVTRLSPAQRLHSSTGSWEVNQENTSSSAQSRAFDNAAFDEEASGNSTPYLSVSSANGRTPGEMAGNAPREATPPPVEEAPPPPCSRPPFPRIRAFPADVTSSAVESAQWHSGSVESTPYTSVAEVSQSSV